MAALLWAIVGAALSLQPVLGESLEVVVKDPSDLIVVGSDVTLQCLPTGLNLSSCKFQMYHKWIRSWINIDTTTTFRCWFYNFNVSRVNGELLLQVKGIYKWHTGPYRCVSNGSEGEIVSDSITIPLQYLNDVSITEPGSHFSHYTRSPRVIRVMKGKSLEVTCSASSSQPPLFQWKRQDSEWIYPNSSLRIEEVTAKDGGTYTCKATHPSIPTLTQCRSVLIEVVEEPLSSLQLNEMNLILAIVLPAGVLLLTAVGIATYMYRARKDKWKKTKFLDDEVVKTPIWKGGSFRSPVTVSDSVPLVM
ncbi:carcinoembryonic antigen-related cell adhesion molecule 20 [Pristis pectinata]|uniref:carcinoembryonic antigen-related cell adhesion molecule 20 n=1 Tax=Pristis pectinata TaxID=685728 RepID=UPI00223E3395|nr:carcinoembryonic antigen-related cell adhesion molecule 20 [Pristis pectinata]